MLLFKNNFLVINVSQRKMTPPLPHRFGKSAVKAWDVYVAKLCLCREGKLRELKRTWNCFIQEICWSQLILFVWGKYFENRILHVVTFQSALLRFKWNKLWLEVKLWMAFPSTVVGTKWRPRQCAYCPLCLYILTSILYYCLFCKDTKTFKTPTPPPPPSPTEVPQSDTFTVNQLLNLHRQVLHLLSDWMSWIDWQISNRDNQTDKQIVGQTDRQKKKEIDNQYYKQKVERKDRQTDKEIVRQPNGQTDSWTDW